MSESGLTVEIVPICTAEDRRKFRPFIRLLTEIVLENRGLSKGEIHEFLGDPTFDIDRSGVPVYAGSAAAGNLQTDGG
jgi:hypothetical protein